MNKIRGTTKLAGDSKQSAIKYRICESFIEAYTCVVRNLAYELAKVKVLRRAGIASVRSRHYACEGGKTCTIR